MFDTAPEQLRCQGLLLGRMRNSDEAEPDMRHLIEPQPTHANALANLAVLLLKQERHAEARTEAEAAIAIQPDLPEAHGKGQVKRPHGGARFARTGDHKIAA